MGFISDIFGGGNDTHTTTSSAQYPDNIRNLQNQLYDGAAAGMAPFLNNPQTPIAARNDFQTKSGDAYSDALNWVTPRDYSGSALGYVGSVSPGTDRSAALDPFIGALTDSVGANNSGGAMATYGGGNAAMPAAAHIDTINYGDIAGFMNPYQDAMTDTIIGRIDDQKQKNAADIAGRAARRGAFGGSGEAIGNFLNDKNASEQAQDAATQIAYDSYGQGLDVARTNQAVTTQAQDRFINTLFNNLANDRAAIAATDSSQNAYFNRDTGANQFDINAILNSDTLTQSNYDRNRANRQDDINNINTVSDLDNAYLNRWNTAAGNMGAYGDSLMDYAQQVEDRDYLTFSRLAGFVPGYQPTTVQTQPVYRNNAGMLAGLGSLAGAFKF